MVAALDPSADADESVDGFFTRHFGEEFARTFASALVHGIYATDSRILSVRAAFPTLREMEARGGGSVVRGAISEMLSGMTRRRTTKVNDTQGQYDLGDVQETMRGVSVFSFKDGMQTLTDAMENELRTKENVDIVTGDGAAALSACVRIEDGYEVSPNGVHQISEPY